MGLGAAGLGVGGFMGGVRALRRGGGESDSVSLAQYRLARQGGGREPRRRLEVRGHCSGSGWRGGANLGGGGADMWNPGSVFILRSSLGRFLPLEEAEEMEPQRELVRAPWGPHSHHLLQGRRRAWGVLLPRAALGHGPAGLHKPPLSLEVLASGPLRLGLPRSRAALSLRPHKPLPGFLPGTQLLCQET